MAPYPLWKTVIVLTLCLLGCLIALPNILTPAHRSHLATWMPHAVVNLGLDLQGGSHILLEVDLKTGLQDRLNATRDDIRKTLRAEKIGYLDLVLNEEKVTFKLRNPGDFDRVVSALRGQNQDLQITQQEETTTARFTANSLEQRKRRIVEQSIESVRRRIDEVGTREPLIQRQGDDRILIQLPGLENPQHIKSLLGKTAKLSFCLLDADTPEVDSSEFVPPVGAHVLPADHSVKEGENKYYVVRKEILLGGDSLADAGVHFDEYQRPEVSFRFDSQGGKRFGSITAQNIGRRLAIVLDNKVISAPRINSAIHSNGSISGNFSFQEAADLALLMRAGALVAPLTVLEERIVGPDLGADSVQAGSHATIISIILVGIFMMVAYALFGIIANIAMLFNLILLIAALSLVGATLTLPGIAGIALTMGMAVDANVLINERIKEELRLGRRPYQAIEAGYQRAMATIIDSNITTVIGALALFFFGTGPVRGFGITLTLGILVSMFTAITLSRLIVTYSIRWLKPQELSI